MHSSLRAAASTYARFHVVRSVFRRCTDSTNYGLTSLSIQSLRGFSVESNERIAGTSPSIFPPQVESRIRWILKLMGYYSRESVLIRNAKVIFAGMRKQASRPEFHAIGLGTTPTTEFSIVTLHMWMYFARLRSEGEDGKNLQKELFILFMQYVDKLIRNSPGVKTFLISKFVRECQTAFYSSCLVYDEAVLESDSVLASALWRYTFAEAGRSQDLASILLYVRRELANQRNSPLQVMVNGEYKYSVPDPNSTNITQNNLWAKGRVS
mmetsp:Transcript_23175/g.38133  ORF Transcript_23175/g.38133 Transcript_23175/m.38133 type:complete len:267 (-) Transcript_23175:65-865(-)